MSIVPSCGRAVSWFFLASSLANRSPLLRIDEHQHSSSEDHSHEISQHGEDHAQRIQLQNKQEPRQGAGAPPEVSAAARVVASSSRAASSATEPQSVPQSAIIQIGERGGGQQATHASALGGEGRASSTHHQRGGEKFVGSMIGGQVFLDEPELNKETLTPGLEAPRRVEVRGAGLRKQDERVAAQEVLRQSALKMNQTEEKEEGRLISASSNHPLFLLWLSPENEGGPPLGNRGKAVEDYQRAFLSDSSGARIPDRRGVVHDTLQTTAKTRQKNVVDIHQPSFPIFPQLVTLKSIFQLQDPLVPFPVLLRDSLEKPLSGLSMNHASDVLRAYLLHTHGGGYSDLKKPHSSDGVRKMVSALNDPSFFLSGLENDRTLVGRELREGGSVPGLWDNAARKVFVKEEEEVFEGRAPDEARNHVGRGAGDSRTEEEFFEGRERDYVARDSRRPGAGDGMRLPKAAGKPVQTPDKSKAKAGPAGDVSSIVSVSDEYPPFAGQAAGML